MTIFLIVCALLFIVLMGVLAANHDQEKDKKRKDFLQEKQDSIPDFSATTTITGVRNFYKFMIDEDRKKVAYIDNIRQKVFTFDQIRNVEVSEDSKTVYSSSTLSTIGRTIIGEAVAGTAGAIIGGLTTKTKESTEVSSINVKILLNDSTTPSFSFFTLDSKKMSADGKPLKTSEFIYKQAIGKTEKIVDAINTIIQSQRSIAASSSNQEQHTPTISVADELKKLVELKECGVLTEEEFEEQKRRVLR